MKKNINVNNNEVNKVKSKKVKDNKKLLTCEYCLKVESDNNVPFKMCMICQHFKILSVFCKKCALSHNKSNTHLPEFRDIAELKLKYNDKEKMMINIGGA